MALVIPDDHSIHIIQNDGFTNNGEWDNDAD